MSITPANVFAIAPELTSGSPQTQTVTFSAAITSGHTITGSVAGNPVNVPFNTTNAQTLNDLTALIAEFPQIGSVSNNGTNQLTVTGLQNGVSILISLSVTGAGPPTVAVVTTVYPVAGQTTTVQVNAAINTAAAMMNSVTWGDLYDIAQTYLAAHLLSLSTLKGKVGVANERVGGLARGYNTLNKPYDQAFYLTAYGTQYLALRDMLIITPISTACGGTMPWAGTFPYWGAWPFR